jgi:hypothetical protein
MAATLKWDGDELKLGTTKMAEVAAFGMGKDSFRWRHAAGDWSEFYRDRDDARQDCENAVRALLKKAGA